MRKLLLQGKRRLGLGLPALLLLLAACGRGVEKPYLEDLYRELRERPDPRAVRSLAGRRILIDPGHGGRFAGTVGSEGTREADVNLGVALYLWGLLEEAGAEAFLTRAADLDLLPEGSGELARDLASRVALAESLDVDVFLSLHHNASASLDSDRNQVETYYPLGEDGPSRDLARAVHRNLVRNLGIRENAILPGNYYVLRNAPVPAVLGEPSYLSHPPVEERLKLSEKQRLEAGAYFLGLVEYFSRGLPRLEWIAPEADTLARAAPLEVRAWDDGGLGVDPLSLSFRVNGREVAVIPRPAGGVFVHPLERFASNGRYHVEVDVRNLLGNRSHTLARDLVLDRPPAFLHLRVRPDSLPAGRPGQVRLQVFAADSTGRSVLDGRTVAWEAEGLILFGDAARTTRGGSAAVVGYWPGRESPASVRVSCAAVTLEREIPLRADGPALLFPVAYALDPDSGPRPLADVLVLPPRGAPRLTAADGSFAMLPIQADSAPAGRWHLLAPGRIPVSFLPGRGVPDREIALGLRPRFGEAPFARTVVLDPAGGGSDPAGTGPTGVRGSWLALEICRSARALLEGAGVRCVLTREEDRDASLLDRIRRAGESGADLYVRLALSPPPGDTTSAPVVVHYPGSAGGARFAAACAARLDSGAILGGSLIGGPVRIRQDERPVLRDTPCPAAVVLPLKVERPAGETFLEDVAGRTALAHALALAVLDALFPPDSEEAHLLVHAPAAAAGVRLVLDRAWTLYPKGRDRLLFTRLPPGPHLLEVHAPGRAAPADSTWLRLTPGDTLDYRLDGTVP
jgi:N-acetylmuramoyl-L-alanine amidase